MIRIVANFHLKQEMVEEAIKLAKELVEITRTEKGCVQYDLAQSVESPQHIVILEAWETKEALDAHSNSEHFARMVPAIAGMCEEPPAVNNFIQLV